MGLHLGTSRADAGVDGLSWHHGTALPPMASAASSFLYFAILAHQHVGRATNMLVTALAFFAHAC